MLTPDEKQFIISVLRILEGLKKKLQELLNK